MSQSKRRGLGRGLDALLTTAPRTQGEDVQIIHEKSE